MINRRFAIKGLAATASAAALATNAHADDNPPTTAISGSLAMPRLEPRMNMAQAFKIMDQLGLDALVVGEGINVYHASGYWPITARMGHAPSTFAIVTRNESQPVSIVLSAFTYYYQLADIHRTDDYPVYLYTAPTGDVDENGDPIATPVSGFPNREEVPMDPVESRRASLASAAEKEKGAWAGAKYAMAKALKDLGLSKGTLAADHRTVRGLLDDAAPNATVVDADTALRYIRPVKSDLEIQLMRAASKANVEAAIEAVKSVRAGAMYREFRAEYFAQAARRGNRGVFLVVDRVSAETFDAPFRDGQAFLIDAVSEFQGYHGDYGRTVFIGEPAKAMQNATKAMGDAWTEVRHALKPGMRFSEIITLGQQTLKKMNANYTVSFTPHSVGLYHTDHVGSAGAAAFREDPVLEKGMIISVDCPLLEAGVGGSAHLEDLTLITADGSEPIHDVGDQTIMI